MSYSVVRELLANPFYTGDFIWNGKKYNGNHPAMVTQTEFEKMQEILMPNHASRPQKDPHAFILRGMLTCKECGYAIVTEEKYKRLSDGSMKKYRYCHCCGKNPKKKCKFKSVYVREDELLRQIKNELSKYTIDEEFYKIAIEALAEEDDIEVAKQNEKIAKYNKQISDKKNELNSLRHSVYRGLIDDQDFFLSEQASLNADIEALVKERNGVMVAAHDWREKATDIFMFVRYAKEDFDSDDWERKRAVIKRLGADLKLAGRTIRFTPVKYLVPIENKCPELKHHLRRLEPTQNR